MDPRVSRLCSVVRLASDWRTKTHIPFLWAWMTASVCLHQRCRRVPHIRPSPLQLLSSASQAACTTRRLPLVLFPPNSTSRCDQEDVGNLPSRVWETLVQLSQIHETRSNFVVQGAVGPPPLRKGRSNPVRNPFDRKASPVKPTLDWENVPRTHRQGGRSRSANLPPLEQIGIVLAAPTRISWRARRCVRRCFVRVSRPQRSHV